MSHIMIASRGTLSEIKKLAYSPYDMVRWAVARNPNATEKVKLMVRSYDKFGHLTK